MILPLILFSHFFACLWMLLGFYGFGEESGWLYTQFSDGQQSLDQSKVYVSSLYFIITSFSSVGYGDIKAASVSEEVLAILIEMLGIGVFGYMIGTLQKLFIGFHIKDQTTELQEMIDLWMIQLDKTMPEVLHKKIFKDVRDFYVKKFKHETNTAREYDIFG